MKTLIKNCHIISPDLELPEHSILCENGVITDIMPVAHSDCLADTTYDAQGAYAFPGFIDIHFHGAGGYDVTDGLAEGIEKIAELKLQEGVTTICPTTLTLTEPPLAKAMQTIADYSRTAPFAKIAGAHLEGPFINPACTGAQNPAFARAPDMDEVERLNAIAKVAIVSYAPDVDGGIAFTESLSHAGIVPSAGHSDATYEQIIEAKSKGLKHLTHFCNQMSKLHHRQVGMVGAGLMDPGLTIELICDKIHLCPEMIQLAFKCKGCEKIVLITDAMSASWLDDGEYDLGGLTVNVADGAARLASNGALAGSTLRYYNALKNAYEVTGLPLKELVKTTSLNQATSLGLENVGKISKGYCADITILDRSFSPQAVFVDGAKKL